MAARQPAQGCIILIPACAWGQARKKIAQAKVVAPRTVLAILDEAMQTYGGAGLSQDTPLAKLYAQTRTLRLADGPDAVHLASIGKLELKEAAQAARPRSKL